MDEEQTIPTEASIYPFRNEVCDEAAPTVQGDLTAFCLFWLDDFDSLCEGLLFPPTYPAQCRESDVLPHKHSPLCPFSCFVSEVSHVIGVLEMLVFFKDRKGQDLLCNNISVFCFSLIFHSRAWRAQQSEQKKNGIIRRDGGVSGKNIERREFNENLRAYNGAGRSEGI